jgi:hypothetical protein
MPSGSSRFVRRAGKLSPLKPPFPVPTYVLTTPPATLRMRMSNRSAMNAVAPDTATVAGELNCAAVAGPPSPQGLVLLAQVLPFPANVLITPAVFTFLTRLLKGIRNVYISRRIERHAQ